ncbi:MAG: hypothetical protein LBH03_06025 [Holophagales bacterium]|jgi:hypothetical protein|nr:hypothetical protein [Holophagales bacterium]
MHIAFFGGCPIVCQAVAEPEIAPVVFAGVTAAHPLAVLDQSAATTFIGT